MIRLPLATLSSACMAGLLVVATAANAQSSPAAPAADAGRLLLRPMNFDTLATWLYAEAARGTYEEGAVAALAIVLAGLLPVILLARTNLKMGH